MHIHITSNGFNRDELIGRLQSMPGCESPDVTLILRKKKQVFRTLDPTVVLAITSAASAGLGALITGLLGIAKERKAKVIVIQDKEGRRLEVPVDYSKAEIQALLEVVRQMESAKIEIP